jgi:hypothetical protein
MSSHMNMVWGEGRWTQQLTNPSDNSQGQIGQKFAIFAVFAMFKFCLLVRQNPQPTLE